MARKNPYSGDEMKRYLGSLKEHFTDGVKLIGEKVDLVDKKVDRGFAEVNKTLESHTERIGEIMIRLEEIKGELKQKVDYSDFVKLEKRVVRLEARAAHY